MPLRGIIKQKSLWLQGDLIPWTVGQQFQDADFPRLSGARIVRIAVHPSLTRAGYVMACLSACLPLAHASRP